MPTNKPRVTFTVSDETLSMIDAYRFTHKCKNQSQAILSLIERGFEVLADNTDVPTTNNSTLLSNSELARISAAMETLNNEGRERVVEYAEDLAACGRYKKLDSHGMDKKKA